MQKNSGKPGQEVSRTLLLFPNGPLIQASAAELSWSGSKANTKGKASGAVAG